MKFLNFLNTPFDIELFRNHPVVVAEAHEIGSKVALDGRTRAQAMIDSSNGITLQYAVFDVLSKKGVDIQWETSRKEWDLVISEDSNIFKIDTKGIFKSFAKNWTQTWWESTAVPKLDHDVIYLCFDCKSKLSEFRGWCDQRAFTPSQFNTPPYVPLNKLTM